MNDILLPVLYAPPAIYVTLFLQDNQIHFEKHENFVKSTSRNRAYVCGPNGRLRLSIPILGGKGKRQRYKDVVIDNSQDWQKIHFQSLASCYRRSPYFEFYEDELYSFYSTDYKHLMNFNLKLFNYILDCIGIQYSPFFTEKYQECWKGKDLRDSFKKYEVTKQNPYLQVFDKKNGFIPGLSIFDIMFNLGPETYNYLKSSVNKPFS